MLTQKDTALVFHYLQQKHTAKQTSLSRHGLVTHAAHEDKHTHSDTQAAHERITREESLEHNWIYLCVLFLPGLEEGVRRDLGHQITIPPESLSVTPLCCCAVF